jgi:hypothetical protein
LSSPQYKKTSIKRKRPPGSGGRHGGSFSQRLSGRSIAAPGPDGSGKMMVMVKCPDISEHGLSNGCWGGRTRTFGILVNSQAHCQLCYAPIGEKSGINLIETLEKVKK